MNQSHRRRPGSGKGFARLLFSATSLVPILIGGNLIIGVIYAADSFLWPSYRQWFENGGLSTHSNEAILVLVTLLLAALFFGGLWAVVTGIRSMSKALFDPEPLEVEPQRQDRGRRALANVPTPDRSDMKLRIFNTGVPQPDGSVIYTSKGFAWARVFATGLLAAFWNGAIGFGLADLGFRAGIIPFLFLLPFILIGLFLLWLTLKQILATAHPMVQVVTAPGEIKPGQEKEFTWKLHGRRYRVRHLSIHLAAVAVRTPIDSEGTNEEESIVFDQSLVEQSLTGPYPSGRGTFTIPLEPPTPSTPDLKRVDWVLAFYGDAPGWVELRVEFPLKLD